ncbi:MAG TPA: hypothetical protein VGO50_15510 [Pyrinomonadaceae bacterium]|jgi:hypothetical protein|nr:hypothetical protein [Pyrinomonadaceae bacterium]
MKFIFTASVGAAIFFIAPGITSINGQNKPCPYDPQTLQFTGTPPEQARCLLRPNKIGGVLAEPLDNLPKPLEKLIGQKVEIKKEKLERYLLAYESPELILGGAIKDPLSVGTLPSGEKLPALYFIIHDTSSPYLADEEFPTVMDYNSWTGNILDQWLKQPVAHVFVNRAGHSITICPFSETVKSGWGTKFSRDFQKAEGKGLQLHIELVQPRRRSPGGPPQNDLIAPVPGFTQRQYERLALLYVCASFRRGTWMVPSYHSAIDAGIKGAHDDPQNFELENFAEKLNALLKTLK